MVGPERLDQRPPGPVAADRADELDVRAQAAQPGCGRVAGRAALAEADHARDVRAPRQGLSRAEDHVEGQVAEHEGAHPGRRRRPVRRARRAGTARRFGTRPRIAAGARSRPFTGDPRRPHYNAEAGTRPASPRNGRLQWSNELA